MDFPTLPLYGRRGDIVYVAPEHVTPGDWERGYPQHVPDLVIEVVSEGDEARDYREKRDEYASIGIPNYWIVDPTRRSVHLLILAEGGEYRVEQRLGLDDTLTSPLFPGLGIPLRRLFRRG